ncbi:PqqD family peptide modification chaperone [soil metagenome]
MLNLQTLIKRSEHPLSSPIADELVMFDTQGGKYYGLNEIATEIWNRLEKPLSIGQLCNSLTKEFDVGTEQCRKEVLEFLPKLLEKGLIKEVTSR